MPIVHSLVVSMAVLRLVGSAYHFPDVPPPVQIAPANSLMSATAALLGGSGRILSSLLPTFVETREVPLPPVVTATLIPTPAPFSIEYRITGTATHCAATYETAAGATNQRRVDVPFTYNWNGAKSGDFVYVSCQIDTATDSGDLLVAIYKNGVLYKSATAVAFPSSATASGYY
jgi:hypothetical protein